MENLLFLGVPILKHIGITVQDFLNMEFTFKYGIYK